MNEIGKAQRVPEVPSQMESLEKTIGALDNAIEDLYIRIGPVLANSPDGPFIDKLSEIRKSCTSPLGNSILAKIERLESILEKVRNVISKVEV